MHIDLKGKRAVVMGGSKGIGRSIALGLARGRRGGLDLRTRAGRHRRDGGRDQGARRGGAWG